MIPLLSGIHITNTGAIWIFFGCLAALMVYLSGRERQCIPPAVASASAVPSASSADGISSTRLSDRDTLLVKLAIILAILAIIC